MRRWIALVLVLIGLWSMTACNADDAAPGAENDTTTAAPAACPHTETVSDGGCTGLLRCKACGRVVGRGPGHAWKEGACETCGKADPLGEKTEGVLRVVCVGDSITKGGYWANRFQGNLDDGYEVIGLGVNGATGLAEGLDQGKPWAYILHDEYELSLRYNPDAVVVMLGTNDTKGPNYSKIEADGGAQYKADMIALIESYQHLPAQPQIFLALPPTVYRAWTASGINNEALEELLLTLLQEIATETGAIVIDTHTATAGRSEMFPDGVHPNDDGKALIAQTVAQGIVAYYAPIVKK